MISKTYFYIVSKTHTHPHTHTSSHTIHGVDKIIPVEDFSPGCPPRPHSQINRFIKLHDKIQSAPLGANRIAAEHAAEKVALTAIPTSQMKGLLA